MTMPADSRAPDGRAPDGRGPDGRAPDGRAPDGGWGWMVVFAAFFLNLLNGGIFSVHGMLYEEFLDTFPELTKTSTAWLISAQAGLCYISGLCTGALLTVLTSRTVTVVGTLMISTGLGVAAFAPDTTVLSLTFTLLAGMGMGLQCLPSSVMVQLYFHRKRALAAAIGLCGGSSGVFVYPPLCRMLMDTYGWRGTLLLLAGLLLHSVPLGLLLRPLPPATTNSTTKLQPSPKETRSVEPPDKRTQSRRSFLRRAASFINKTFDVKVLRLPSCCVMLSCWFLTYFGYTGFYTFITVKGTAVKLTRTQTSLLISVCGILETVGRFSSGVLGNLRCVNRVYLFAAGMFLCGLSSLVGAALGTFTLLLLYSVVFGLAIGMFVGLGPTVCVDLLGKEVLPRVLGFSFLTGGFGSLISIPFLAFTWESTGLLSVPFLIMGSSQVVATIILLTFYRCIGTAAPETVEVIDKGHREGALISGRHEEEGQLTYLGRESVVQ